MKVAEALFGFKGSPFFVQNPRKPVLGRVLFTQENSKSPVRVHVALRGLERGNHGFHVHEKSLRSLSRIPTSSENCCKLLGGHFNGGKPIWSPSRQNGTPHGKHVGDLCMNIYSKGEQGEVSHTFYDHRISLYKKSPCCVLNRSLVIHANKDDMGQGVGNRREESLQTGNAGERIACSDIWEIRP